MRVLLASLLLLVPPVWAQGRLDGDINVFTVMAALHAAGYRVDVDSPANHPARRQMIDYLASRHLKSAGKLADFYHDHTLDSDAANLGQYISYALLLDGPPDFHLRTLKGGLPPDVQRLEGFNVLLAEFYQEAGIGAIWRNAQTAFDQVIERYHRPTAAAIFELNGYLRHTTSGSSGPQFNVIVSLLAPPNQIQSRNYEGEYYIVLTPSAEPQISDIRYAYLHYLLDPLATRFQDKLYEKKALGDYALGAPYLPEFYKSDFLLLATTSLIKAIEARLAPVPAAQKAAMVEEDYRRGYILAPHFAEQLPVYEKQEQSMRYYFPEMVDAIDLAKEEKRASTLEFDQTAPVRVAKPVEVQEPKLSPTDQALRDAEDLIRNKDLDKAREIFLRVAGENVAKPQRAKAYYGLARIATLQNRPEEAMTLFEKTLELAPEPQDKAWSLVYLGRLHDLAGEPDEALRQYQAALQVEGAPENALNIARQGAAGAFHRKPEETGP